MTDPLPLAIPECRLDAAGVGPQIARYRELARHVIRIERVLGEVRVDLSETVPEGLLGLTLDVERRCCSFLTSKYDARARRLTFTVENVAQDPRLDTLALLLTPPA